MPIGFTVPFAQATGSLGYLETTNDELSAVRENLKSLMLTNWGERVMNYNFGCNFLEFLFDNHDSELSTRIEDRIVSQISTWMPFVTVTSVSVTFSDEDETLPENSIQIDLSFKVASRPNLT